MMAQAASAVQDLAVISPGRVMLPMIDEAADDLRTISSPQRRSVALRLLATSSPTFLDLGIFAPGIKNLPQAHMLTLPSFDPNQRSKIELTFTFLAYLAACVQG